MWEDDITIVIINTIITRNSLLTIFINHAVLFDVSAAGTAITEQGQKKSPKFVSSASLSLPIKSLYKLFIFYK